MRQRRGALLLDLAQCKTVHEHPALLCVRFTEWVCPIGLPILPSYGFVVSRHARCRILTPPGCFICLSGCVWHLYQVDIRCRLQCLYQFLSRLAVYLSPRLEMQQLWTYSQTESPDLSADIRCSNFLTREELPNRQNISCAVNCAARHCERA